MSTAADFTIYGIRKDGRIILTTNVRSSVIRMAPRFKGEAVQIVFGEWMPIA